MDLNELNSPRREDDCDKHTIREAIIYKREGVVAPRHDLLAAILRTCAIYADGECAVKGAEDAKILTTGLVLHFSSEAKYKEFWRYVEQFVPFDLRMKLHASRGSAR